MMHDAPVARHALTSWSYWAALVASKVPLEDLPVTAVAELFRFLELMRNCQVTAVQGMISHAFAAVLGPRSSQTYATGKC